MTTWSDALDEAFAQNRLDRFGGVNVYNDEFRNGLTRSCSTAGSIQIDGGGVYTVTNASMQTELTDLNEDEVDEALKTLGVSDSDWSDVLVLYEDRVV